DDQHTVGHRKLVLVTQRRDIFRLNSKFGVLDRPIPDQFRHNPFRDAHRNREAYTCRGTGGRFNLRVDANHPAVRIEERTVAITWIDRRVSLNRSFDQSLILGVNRSLETTDNARGQRSIESEWISDRQDLLTYNQMVRVAERRHRHWLLGLFQQTN